MGCGTGLLTERLATKFPTVAITAVDPAPGMINQAIRQHLDLNKVVWHIGAADTWRAATPVDLIVSNAALHWSTDLTKTFLNLASMLKPGGTLYATLMVEGTLRELHESRFAAAPQLPPRTRMPGLMQLDTAAKSAGLSVDDLSVQPYTTHAPSSAHLLQALHLQGLTGGPLSQGERLLTRGELKALTAYYDEHFSDKSGTVTATYETALLIATRA